MRNNLGFLNMGLILSVAFILSRDLTIFGHWSFGVVAIIVLLFGFINFLKQDKKQEDGE